MKRTKTHLEMARGSFTVPENDEENFFFKKDEITGEY